MDGCNEESGEYSSLPPPGASCAWLDFVRWCYPRVRSIEHKHRVAIGQVLTTFDSCGEVSPHHQAEIIKGMGAARAHTVELQDLAQKLAELARRSAEAPAEA